MRKWFNHFSLERRAMLMINRVCDASIACHDHRRDRYHRLFFGIVIIGLSWRGLSFTVGNELDTSTASPATTFGDQLKRGVSDGIIGEPEQREVFQPTPVIVEREV